MSFLRAFAGVVLFVACSSSSKTSGTSTCTPGALQDCTALNGCRGVQRCEAERTWGECTCLQSTGGTSGASGGPAGGSGGATGGNGPGGAGGVGPGGTGPGGTGPGGASGMVGVGGAPPDAGPGGTGSGGDGGGPVGGTGGTGGSPQNCPASDCASASTAFGASCMNTVQCACTWCSCDLIACANDPGCTAIVGCALANGCTAINPGCFTSGGPCVSVVTAYQGSLNAAIKLNDCTTANHCPNRCGGAM